MSDLGAVLTELELVDPEVRGRKHPHGKTQRDAVMKVLEVFGDELTLEELAELASQEYGRRITLGNCLHAKWLLKRAAKERTILQVINQ